MVSITPQFICTLAYNLQALHTSLRLLLSTSLRLLYYVQEFYKYSAVLYKYNICIYAREEISTQVLRFIVCDLSSKRLRNAVSYITQATGMLSPILLKPPRDAVSEIYTSSRGVLSPI